MAADEGALARTNRWLVSRFAQYYARAELDLPFRYTKREWAFLFFDKSFMVRHLAFDKRDRIQTYLRDQAPRHAYYSTAFYQDPGARTMLEKGWKGATLVFDLDSDHLPGASKMTYEEMLAEVKKEFIKLVDKWLINKFGYDADDVHIVFSGGRGYHAHIEDPRVLELDAHERREIVDLITGKSIDLSTYFRQVAITGGKRMDGRGYTRKTYMLPPSSIGDWKGDLTKEAEKFYGEILHLVTEGQRPKAVKKIAELWKYDEIKAIYHLELLLKAGVAGHQRIDWLLSKGHADLEEGMTAKDWEPLFNNLHIAMLGETDEPVTGDVKRLIRLPSSIHGKTGFVARHLTRDELDAFDPLQDALAFGRSAVEVEGTSDVSFELGGVTHHLERGKVVALPEYAAVFACLRGSAQIPPR